MHKSDSKIIVISSSDDFEKESLPILMLETKVLILAIQKVHVLLIDGNIYSETYELKRTQVFAVSVSNLEYQAKKKLDKKLI